MKSKILLCVLCVLCGFIAVNPSTAFAQEIHHKFYTTDFSQQLHEPVWVAWTLTPAMLKGQHLARTNNFKADPQIPNTSLGKDYAGSGFDQGHQMPAQDNSGDATGENECFFFSNMVPQKPNLNRVTWKALEMACRKEVLTTGKTLQILCGPLGAAGAIGPDKVSVPAFCWKAVNDGQWTCYLMPNADAVDAKPYTAYTLTLAALDAKLGFKVEDLK